MRPFELLLWTASAGWAILPLACRVSRRLDATIAIGVLTILVVQLVVEGPRFHLVPTYALALGALASAQWRLKSPARSRRLIRIGAALSVVLLAALAFALPSIFPVYQYVTPGGPFAIGTSEYVVAGASRQRELVIQAWYPADPGRQPTVGITSRPDLLAKAYAGFSGLPAVLFDHLRLIRTHAVSNAPMAAARRRFPVILFSHGPLAANRSQSLFLMEALASRGFVSIAIDHTGYASTTIFPDGHAVPPGPEAAWPAIVDEKSSAMVKTWVDDVRVVVDRLTVMNGGDAGGVLTGRLNLSRIGYVGASFGGSVVVQALLDEPRIRAGVAQDGKPYFFDETLTRLQKPLMYMQSAAPYIRTSDAQLAKWGLTVASFKTAEQDHYRRLMLLFANTAGPIYNVFIGGTDHVTFSDLHLAIRIPTPGAMVLSRAHGIIGEYTAAFFNRFLNDVPSPLVDGHSPAPYDEVTVSSRNVDLLWHGEARVLP